MITKTPLYALVFLTLSSFTLANEISDDDILKAFKGITEIKELPASEPKIISEVLIKEKKVTKKIIKKKRYKKKSHKKKRVNRREPKENLNDLPIAKTLGVVNTSKTFESNQ